MTVTLAVSLLLVVGLFAGAYTLRHANRLLAGGLAVVALVGVVASGWSLRPGPEPATAADVSDCQDRAYALLREFRQYAAEQHMRRCIAERQQPQ